MNWFFYYQKEPEGHWYLDLADQREANIKKYNCPFTTILDLDTNFDEEVSAEDAAKTCYRGPMYIDLDSKDPEEVIEQFQKLLTKLEEEYGVDLNQCLLYLTGGRGFHITLPESMFQQKVPARGTPLLPLIYREIANELFVDTLDLNIYSTKRGRMFRTVNVQRPNGNFKVQISVEEAKAMTLDKYQSLCKEPRYLPPAAPPTYHPKLGLLHAKAVDKLDILIKNRKSAKADTALIQQFKGKTPPTLTAVMKGEGIAENIGFQKIATQLAIAAHALGRTEQEFLAECEGLIENHVGDSTRYGSPAKRRVELRRMFQYMDGHPGYVFSVGGIKSLMDKDFNSRDLDMGGVAPDGEETDEEMEYSTSQGVRINSKGIFRKTDEGLVQVSALGLSDPRQLLDIETGEVHGYDVIRTVNGKAPKRVVMHMDALQSRSSFLKFSLSVASCNVALTDVQVAAFADIMRTRTENSNQQVYTIRREGLDVLQLPNGDIDIVWADQYGVDSTLGVNYRLTGSMTSELQFRTDLRNAPDLEDTPETREFFDNLFRINDIETIGRFFGFFTACFISQPIRHVFGQFPFLQVYGPAGSGKSQTTRLFTHMHYYKNQPVINSALDSTKFLYEEMATCSGSMPFVLDEYKPREMRKDIFEKSKGILRSNYNGDMIGKGAVQSSTGASKLTLTRTSNRSPIAVISEAMISQSAQLERCVVVPITKEGRAGNRDAFVYCQEHAEVLGMLGRFCFEKAKVTKFEGLRKQVNHFVQQVREQVGAGADENERPIFNVAICLTGLHFARSVMKYVFGERYETSFAGMMQGITVTTTDLIPKVMSEATKALSDIAHLSRYAEDERYKTMSGEDYVVAGNTVFLRVKNVYVKYVKFKRSMGDEVLYDTYESFYSAMRNYTGMLDDMCLDSPLKDSANTHVMAFDLAKLYKDGVEEFASS